MVNKQYSISDSGNNCNTRNDLSSLITKKIFSIKRNIKRNSATLGNISIISLHPEPDPLFMNSVNGSYYQKCSMDGDCRDSACSSSSMYNDGKLQNNAYIFAEETLDNNDVVTPRFSSCAILKPVQNVKELTINDIGRFQYILEMDNELVCRLQ